MAASTSFGAVFSLARSAGGIECNYRKRAGILQIKIKIIYLKFRNINICVRLQGSVYVCMDQFVMDVKAITTNTILIDVKIVRLSSSAMDTKKTLK